MSHVTNRQLGFCIICGHATSRNTMYNRRCPRGHGELGIISHRVVKVFLKKNQTGLERIESLKENLPNNYQRLLRDKHKELGIDLTPPKKITKRYGQVNEKKVTNEI